MNVNPAKLLEDELWNSVENIGQGHYDGLAECGEDAIRAYADGVKSVLIHGLERLHTNATDVDAPANKFDTFAWVRQLRAAVGEQLRRRDPNGRCCKGRLLNEILCQIRDWRIALWDGDDRFMHKEPGARKTPNWILSDRLERWHRQQPTDEDWALVDSIRNELRSVTDLYFHLGVDREWQRKHFDFMQPKQGVAA